ncbi:cardioacceleratory peptide receptor-like [Chironomus tepperi]|uniref:cardioacceleratory peptide receptor-like n=1 Tax=Chironomus tepperi TaxID=113505 RepID=UPI00391F3511
MSVIIMNISTTTASPYPSTTNLSMAIHNNDSVFGNEQHITYQTAAEYATMATTMTTIYDPTMASTSTISSVTKTTTENVTNDEFNQFYFYETEQFTVLWILFAVIVLGNSAVLVTLYLNKRKSRMNFFIKQLAIADLCVGLLNVMVDIIWRFTVTWEAGNLACKFIKFMQALVTYASTYVLVALSIDRYDAITHPMNFSNCWKRAKLLVIFAWFFSGLFSIPLFILYEETVIQGVTQCWIELGDSWRWQLYMTLVATSLFFIPAIIITLCYAIIVKTIWDKGTYKVPKKDRKSRNRLSCDEDDRGSRRASSRGIIPRAKVKTIKMTFVIVIVFIACWSPYIVFDLLQVFDQIPKTQSNIAVATFIQSLAPLNSAANPLIYCLFSTQVMRTLKRTSAYRWLSKVFCCKDPGDQSSHKYLRGQRTLTSSTVTTSLTNSSARSVSIHRPHKVVNFDRQSTIIADTNSR